jgi:hypothetical protein
MRHTGGDRERRQAAYDEAFEKLRLESGWMLGVERDPNSTERARAMARCRFQEAYISYRESRDRLAEELGAGLGPNLPELAYQLWENAGRPWGNSDEHWYRAEAMLRGTMDGHVCRV